jgi:predicted RNA-binding Zn-ribbon protein involved in translation (DUF1610 family)
MENALLARNMFVDYESACKRLASLPRSNGDRGFLEYEINKLFRATEQAAQLEKDRLIMEKLEAIKARQLIVQKWTNTKNIIENTAARCGDLRFNAKIGEDCVEFKVPEDRWKRMRPDLAKLLKRVTVEEFCDPRTRVISITLYDKFFTCPHCGGRMVRDQYAHKDNGEVLTCSSCDFSAQKAVLEESK